MKSSELIRQLQMLDPSGEVEVACDNHDIFFAELLTAYWDGDLQLLIRNPELKGYNITGAKVTQKGYKIVLRGMGVEDVLLDNLNAEIDLSELSPESKIRWENKIKEWREELSQI